MKISDILSRRGKPFPSLEIVPPLKGVTKDELLSSVRPFMEFNPPFINVTCHRDEFEYRPESGGGFSRHLVRQRVTQTAVCAAIGSEFPVEVVPHIICGGASSELIKSQLQDFRFMGISNVMALRGDSLLGEKRFTPEPDGYSHASELVRAIRSSEKEGDDRFCIGVGAYPEKHFEAPNMESDIAWLKHKVDQGADFVITQMFFDNSVYYSFVEKCRAAGITVPIIPGIKPLSAVRQLDVIPEAFSIDIPQDLVMELRSHADDRDACYQIGLEWCSAQVADLLSHGAGAIHFYTMGKPENIVKILSRHF